MTGPYISERRSDIAGHEGRRGEREALLPLCRRRRRRLLLLLLQLLLLLALRRGLAFVPFPLLLRLLLGDPNPLRLQRGLLSRSSHRTRQRKHWC